MSSQAQILDYGYRIVATRNENKCWDLTYNGASIGTYSTIFLADQVACGIRKAIASVRASDLKSDWFKN